MSSVISLHLYALVLMTLLIQAHTGLYPLSYCSVDDAYGFINQLGPGTLSCKIDLKDAFRLLPVHSVDWNLPGIHWKQQFFIDTCLPFGLRSAPYLFN